MLTEHRRQIVAREAIGARREVLRRIVMVRLRMQDTGNRVVDHVVREVLALVTPQGRRDRGLRRLAGGRHVYEHRDAHHVEVEYVGIVRNHQVLSVIGEVDHRLQVQIVPRILEDAPQIVVRVEDAVRIRLGIRSCAARRIDPALERGGIAVVVVDVAAHDVQHDEVVLRSVDLGQILQKILVVLLREEVRVIDPLRAIRRLRDERDGAVVLPVAPLVAEPVRIVARLLRHIDERCRVVEFFVVVLALLRQRTLQDRHRLRPARIGVAEDDEIGIFHACGEPRRIIVGERRRIRLHKRARRRLANDDDHRARRLGGKRVLRRIELESSEALVIVSAVLLRLGDVVGNLLPTQRDRRLRQDEERDVDAEDAAEQEERRPLARRQRMRRQMTRLAHVAAIAKPQEGEKSDDDTNQSGDAEHRLKEIDALVGIRQIERHERCGRQAVLVNREVDDLHEGNRKAHEVERGEECGDGAHKLSVGKYQRLPGCEQEEDSRAAQKVEPYERDVPRRSIRPRVKEREGHAPQDACEEMRRVVQRKQPLSCAVLEERERADHRQKPRQIIGRRHVLADIDVERNERKMKNESRYDIPHALVLLLYGKPHGKPHPLSML